MKRILTYGTFDLLHIGHLNLLKKAKSLGDTLIVGLSTDRFNQEKNKKSILSYDLRKKTLESLDFIDMVIPEDSWDQKSNDILMYSIDTFTIGDDWLGHFDHLGAYCEVNYIKRTPGISSTMLKQILISSIKINKSKAYIGN